MTNGPSADPAEPSKVPVYVWVPALVFTSLLLLFLMYVVVQPPAAGGTGIVHMLLALVSGFAATFMTGTILLRVQSKQTVWGRLTISAASGLAVFVLVFLFGPYQ